MPIAQKIVSQEGKLAHFSLVNYDNNTNILNKKFPEKNGNTKFIIRNQTINKYNTKQQAETMSQYNYTASTYWIDLRVYTRLPQEKCVS